MQVKVIERQAVRVAHLRYTGPVGEPIATFWQSTVYPWMLAHDLLDRPRYGIGHEDELGYDAGVEASSDAEALGPASFSVVPGGKYAVARFEGTAAQIPAAWTSMMREWLPSSGFRLDARPYFEYYPRGAKFDPQTGVFECDICIPVAAA